MEKVIAQAGLLASLPASFPQKGGVGFNLNEKNHYAFWDFLQDGLAEILPQVRSTGIGKLC